MKKFTFSSIRKNLTFWFLILALVPLITGIIIVYQASTNAFEKNTVEKLTAIRDLKVGQVEAWIAERNNDLEGITSDLDLMALGDFFNSPKLDEKSIELKNNALNVLNYQLDNHVTYDEIFVINAKTGRVEISTNSSNVGEDKSKESYFYEPLNTKKLFIKDIYHSVETGENTMDFSAPLYQSADKYSEIIGIVVLRIDLQNSLYSLLLNRTGLGETGETLIVNKDVFALNELLWHQNAPLKLKIKALPAQYASQGKTGIILGNDYRGEKVLAAYTYIPETSWGFVCKQDWSELSTATDAVSRLLLILLIVSGILITVIVYFISQSISSPVVALLSDTDKISNGDYSIRNTVKSKDEIGKLGSAINNMVGNIESKSKIQNGVASISEAVIGQSSRGNYSENILKQLINVTGADMAVFYTLNESENEFQHFDSIGANKNLMQPFMAGISEGEIGSAVVQKKIHYLKNLPNDTLFRYKTSAGEIVPREIITIPVINHQNKVIALVSLVNIYPFTDEALQVIKLSWNLINSSYSNLLASEETATLADHLLLTNQKLEAQSEELQEQSEELQQQADELQKGSDELQLQNQELEMQRRQVEEATRLKSEFLSNMSHELRTPLNSINALSHVLIRQAKHKLSEEENEYLEVVERNGKRLLSLINDILDLSKVEAGKIEMQPKALSLEALLNQITDNIQPLAKQKNLILQFQFSDEQVEIETDENRLHQVLTNVIGNAVKFTDKGGVELSVKTDLGAVHINVKDTGIGISDQMLPYIFDEFRQVDGSTSRTYEGTGLGLAIAKKMIHALHGKITVESVLGKGSVFTISLPKKWEGHVETESYSWSQKQSPDQNKKTILVVDDDPKIVKQISASLEASGYHTIGTTSGKEALMLAVKFKPYAITLDIVMPEMDGWEVLQKLKNNPETSDIPVIIISISNDKQTSFALGAIGYVAKPVNRQVLIREIRKLNLSPAMVMIVDDNPIDRKLVFDILTEENIETIQAESGAQCLELIRTNHPDIIVLDLMMPEMDGFQVLDEIRKKTETRDLPVIVVTAKDLTLHDKELLSGKVATVLTKSTVTPARVYQEIKRILDQVEIKTRTGKIQVRPDSAKRILMVEDNSVAVIQVRKILEKEGIDIDVAVNGEEALKYMQHTIPDGIILDLMMPGIDGFEVLEKIRSTEATRVLPVIILTAKNLTKQDLARLSANNIQQLIQKGDIDAFGLLQKVKSMLGIELQPETIIQKTEVLPPVEVQVPKRESKQNEGKSKILVVEDNADNRLTVRAILGDTYSIIEAVNGEEGLEKTVSELPDLILLDISLPKMNGFEVVKILKDNDKTKNIPVIALTAKAMKNDREEILAAGCDEYVAKPIEQDELLEKIDRWLRR